MNNQPTIFKQIPSIHLLYSLQNQEVSLDFAIGGVNLTYFITQLYISDEENQIILDDYANEVVYISVDKEQILEIEEDLLTHEVTIYLLNGTITIKKLY